jgi:polar amino acid transport system ATP-binding protein
MSEPTELVNADPSSDDTGGRAGSAPGDPIVEFIGVHKHFGINHVLRGIDLSVGHHEVVCFIGASGCGKSTLLRCVNALEEIQEGEIRVAGEPASGPGVDVDFLRREVGIVFQGYNLFPHMSVLRNITLAPAKVLGLPDSQARERAMALLSRIGLADKAEEFPDRLSGGQQQRVAIARALAMEPEVMLLDEITSALDPALVGEVLAMVQELVDDGMTILMATHEMGFARDVADRICFMSAGTLAEVGSPEMIFEHPQDDQLQVFLRRVTEARRM